MKKIIFVFISLFFFQVADAQNWNTEVVSGVTCTGVGANPDAIAKDSSGNIWVSTLNGLFKRANGIWAQVSVPIDMNSYCFRNDLAIDNQNRVWWCGGFNLYYYNGSAWQQYNNLPDVFYNEVKTDENGNAYAMAEDTVLFNDFIIDLQTNSSAYIGAGTQHLRKVKGDTAFVVDEMGAGLNMFDITSGNYIANYSQFPANYEEDFLIAPDNKVYFYDGSFDINLDSGSFINVYSVNAALYSIPVVSQCENFFNNFAHFRVKYYNGNIYFLSYQDSTQTSYKILSYNLQNQTAINIPISVTNPYQLECPAFDIVDGFIVVSGYNTGIGQMFFVTNDLNTNCSAGFTMHPDSTLAHTWLALNTATGVTPISYSWSWGDGGTSTGVTPSHTYAVPDYYPICLTITDAAGCVSTYCDSSTYLSKLEDDMSMVTVNVVTQLPNGISTVVAKDISINISPNPCNTCEITGATNATGLTVTDIVGRKINASFNKSANGFYINLPENSNGIFLIRNIKTGEVVKFVKE